MICLLAWSALNSPTPPEGDGSGMHLIMDPERPLLRPRADAVPADAMKAFGDLDLRIRTS